MQGPVSSPTFAVPRSVQSAADPAGRLRAIEAITDTALAWLSVDELLHELLVRLRRTLQTDLAGVFLVDETGQALRTRAFDGAAQSGIFDVRVPFGVGVAGKIARDAAPMVVDDLSTVDFTGLTGVSVEETRCLWKSAAGVPLRVADKVIGVITATSLTPRHFTSDEVNLMLIVADRVAPAIERQRLVESTREANERLQTLSHQLLNEKEGIRRRVAAELHEEIGQLLTAAKINVESAAALTSPTATAHIDQAVTCINEAMRRVRDMSLALRPSMLDDLGLAAALRWYVDQFAQRTGLRVHHVIQPVPRLSAGAETSLFRIAQEALTNVARHAGAANVWISLGSTEQTVQLRIRDNGVGFDVAAARARAIRGASVGLLGMEERAALVGAAYTVTSVVGDGTDVQIDLTIGGQACPGV
jgi:signal transduction histidine kinase